ncbi:Bug family tripartite tricarboxylate transporter substrate binding protein [Paracandidimonas soli]|uniref:Tripartite-type tricarboxylate transporter receptor subunit TctC n=1 Tax=Paracandidimonas soli TaxID=1917182 RepID=A0A4V2VSM6_9BURK|nr:tripartite tricarboxylate transporter substrate binding protein [Paracandidimonas soli]TCV03000.1 tripartite-type tricarboxylate transporter receptor subunit TctC [Paracandidimonas soli]
MSFPVSLSRLLQTLITGLALATAPFAGAATWPDRPINLIMGFPAGSGVDVVARLIQEPLSAKLGQTVVIQYKPGAAGNIASEYVARAPADGYTLLFGTAATHGSNASLYKDLPFDVEEDFVAVAPVLDVSNALTVNPDVIDAKNLEEFVSIVRANPGKYAFASTGNGAGTHMAFAEFNSRLGLQLLHVPYKGGPEAITSVLRGETCCIMNQVQTVLSHYQAGKVRLLGVTTASPVAAVPDVPTIASSGVPGTENFNSTIWFGIFAPKGTDAAIVETINKAVQETLQDPAIRARFESQGNQVRLESPLQFRRTVHDNRQKWDTVIREADIRLE